MNSKTLHVAIILASAAMLPGIAQAASVYTHGRAEMRAGPENDYPVVKTIRDGRKVDVHGCLSDRSWCDVSYRNDRGWVVSNDLVADYGGHRQKFITLWPHLGIGISAFSLGSYWGSYYQGRPFYTKRSQWESHYNNHYKPSWGPRPDQPKQRHDAQHGNNHPQQQKAKKPEMGPNSHHDRTGDNHQGH